MLPALSWVLPKSGTALPLINRPPCVFFSMRLLRNTGRASRDRAIAVRFSDRLLFATIGAAKSLIAIPKAFFCKTFRSTSPLLWRAMTNPPAAFCTNALFKIAGLAVPVTNTPSRPQLRKVLLAKVGTLDSIQTPVPFAVALVTVTPMSWASPSNRNVIFCTPKPGLWYSPLPEITIPWPRVAWLPSTITLAGMTNGNTSPLAVL